MKSATITLNGKEFPVKGLSVSQTLEEDLGAVGKEGKPATYSETQCRMRNVAIALQNGKAFIPDPDNANGEFQSSDKTTDEVVKLLDGMVEDIAEWYVAEMVVGGLNGRFKPKDKDGSKPQGESPATGS